MYDFSNHLEESIQKTLDWNSENMSKRGFANPLGVNINNVVSYNILNDQTGLTYKKGDTCTFE